MDRRALTAAMAMGAGILAWCSGARAVIKVDLPVSKIYTSAKAVVVAGVVSVDGERRIVEVKVDEVLTGAVPDRSLRIHVAEPPELVKQVQAGQSVVIFVGPPGAGAPRRAVVHLADTWLLAEPVETAKPPAWRTIGPFDGAKSFPGRTGALAAVVRELKAGDKPLRDAVSHEAFTEGNARLLAKVAPGPTFLAAGDVDGDGDLDVLVGGADGSVRLLLTDANGCTDVTDAWGLGRAVGSHGAVADVDGDRKADLLLGRTIWLQRGGKFVPAGRGPDPPAEADWLGAALADANGAGRSDAVVLLRSGKLIVAKNPGSVDKPWATTVKALWEGPANPRAAVFSTAWADDGRLHVMVVGEADITRYAVGAGDDPPADFRRLTGVGLDACKEVGDAPLKVILAAALDYDGSGKTDFIVVTESGGVTLSNRGYGAFLINGFLHKAFHSSPDKPIKWTKPFPFRLGQIAAVAAGRVLTTTNRPRQNLLLVTKDGRLYEVDNSR